MLKRVLVCSEIVIFSVHGDIGGDVEEHLLGEAGDIARLQSELPSVLAKVKRVVVVIGASRHINKRRNTKVGIGFRFVHQPDRGGENQIAETIGIAQ